jgi:hypothetical protein
MTEDQYKTLCARVYVDKDFRASLLKDPKSTAAKLGITLTDDEVQDITKGKEQVISAGKKADDLLASAQARPMFIPIPALKPR